MEIGPAELDWVNEAQRPVVQVWVRWRLYTLSQNSGAKGSRTPDLLNAIQALYQLSYGPGPARGYTSLL